MAAEVTTREPLTHTRSPAVLVFALTARQAVRSGGIWGYIFGATIASSALSYTRIYRSAAERNALAAAYGTNKATSALFGPAPKLQTVAGFTVFKVSMTLMILGAVWGLLTSTRLMRGEEDNARWDILLAGQTTRRRGTLQVLGGLAAGAATLWAVTAAITVAAGSARSIHLAVGASLFFALAMVAAAIMFFAVGAFTSQLGATRRQAAAYASAVLAASYAIRMLADAGIGWHGLIWASPLGWVEELRPLTGTRPLALLPIAAFTAIVAFAAVHLAATRDVGAGVLPDHATARPRLRLLSGHLALGVRLARATIAGWWLAIGVSALLFGLIAKSAGSTIGGASVQSVLGKLGVKGASTEAVLGLCFLMVAVLVGFVAAGLAAAVRFEEASGQLDHLLAGPVSRPAWLGGRALSALVILVLSGLAGGLGAWAGAASQHSGVSFGSLVGAGLNLVAPAVTIYGAGLLTFGLWPKRTSAAAHALLGWSALVVVIGGSLDQSAVSHWVLDTSVFHHMAASPSVSPNWTANAVMLALGVAAALIGGAAWQRRDLQGE